MKCPKCKKKTAHQHVHRCAYGIPETHMAGSERVKCEKCGYEMDGPEAAAQGIKFILDDNMPA